MKALICLLFALTVLLGADDPWDALRRLKTGSDIRIFKVGSATPIDAKSADVTERAVVVILGKAVTEIRKSEIEKIDYRPPAGKPVKSEKETVDAKGNRSVSSGASWSREGWKNIYQRKAAAK